MGERCRSRQCGCGPLLTTPPRPSRRRWVAMSRWWVGGWRGCRERYPEILAPHLDVVLLEAGRIGYGQSGLNSGQAAPRIGPAIEAQVAALGRAAAIAAHAYSVQAIEFAAALVNRHHIDCDLEATSQWEVSLTDRDAAKLERRSSLYRALGFDVPLVDSSAVRSALPSSTRIRNAIAFPAYRLNRYGFALASSE